MLLAFALVGCGTFLQKPDPELEGIITKEQAFDLMKSKAKEWNCIKGRAKLSILPLPYEGHIDIERNLAYLEKTTKRDGEKVVENYYYASGNQAYIYENKNGTETYKYIDLNEKFTINLDLSNYLDLLNYEDVKLEKVGFEKDEFHVGLSFNVKFDGKAYDVEVNYGNSKFNIVIEGIATIVLEKDNSNFFDNFEIDLENFQN
jgi:hypothetical protein